MGTEEETQEARVRRALDAANKMPSHLAPGTPGRLAADAALVAAVDALSPDERRPFVLRYVCNESRADIMARLRITQEQYEARITCALCAVRKALEGVL